MMHITPPVTAKGFDGSHHPKYAECTNDVTCRYGIGRVVTSEITMDRKAFRVLAAFYSNTDVVSGCNTNKYVDKVFH